MAMPQILAYVRVKVRAKEKGQVTVVLNYHNTGKDFLHSNAK